LGLLAGSGAHLGRTAQLRPLNRTLPAPVGDFLICPSPVSTRHPPGGKAVVVDQLFEPGPGAHNVALLEVAEAQPSYCHEGSSRFISRIGSSNYAGFSGLSYRRVRLANYPGIW